MAANATTGAHAPEQITHCFVLKGYDLTWSMLEGEKVSKEGKPVAIRSKNIENRHGRMAPGWYGVILGKSSNGVTRKRYEECRTKLPNMSIPPWGWKQLKYWMGNVVGVVKISHSLPCELCTQSPWAEGPVCNIISDAGWIEKPVPCKGNLGACPIPDQETRDRVRLLAKSAKESGAIYKTNGEVEHPLAWTDVWPQNRKRKKETVLSKANYVAELPGVLDKRIKTDPK